MESKDDARVDEAVLDGFQLLLHHRQVEVLAVGALVLLGLLIPLNIEELAFLHDPELLQPKEVGLVVLQLADPVEKRRDHAVEQGRA